MNKKVSFFGLLVIVSTGLTGCSTFPAWLPSSGPSTAQVIEQEKVDSPILVVEVNDAVARRVLAAQRSDSFAESLTAEAPPAFVVGPGDVLEVSVWEAPPAALFGAAVIDSRAGLTTTRQTTFPEQIVNADGVINVPFAGTVPVAGKTPQQIEADLVMRLKGKANQPQVLVRVVRNATQYVTVVGEVAASTRMPLTAKGERLLDAIAAAGGVRHPVSKITVQVSRQGRVIAMPL
ncbi:polysaccharide biosynthesis/export family protein, partial [uncultured Chloroflexus sp.]|uniref:polysaccharide biosynthesis/export family protein n=1 Tax=uncultured Chloroflexus sp. TaxID=214040 RepID=UPI00260BF88B